MDLFVFGLDQSAAKHPVPPVATYSSFHNAWNMGSNFTAHPGFTNIGRFINTSSTKNSANNGTFSKGQRRQLHEVCQTKVLFLTPDILLLPNKH